MTPLADIWSPMFVTAFLVNIVGSALHVLLRYYTPDYIKLPNEDAVRAAIRSGHPEPRQYFIPYARGWREMRSPEMKQKIEEGPNAVLNVKASGPALSGSSLQQWFLFSLLISFAIAYVASLTIPPGAGFFRVFHAVGTVAWLGYAGGQIPAAIWMGKPWSITAKDVVEGFIYGSIAAGTFGWLWPR
jgi:hypothetical protein